MRDNLSTQRTSVNNIEDLKPIPTQEETRKSLRFSLWDGVGWSIMFGLGELYFSPYAIFLGAANIVLGILTTLPHLIGSFSQLATSGWIRRLDSRKHLVLLGVCVQMLTLGLLLFIPSLGKHRLAILFAILTLYWISALIINPAWQSWIGDLVPQNIRGNYFAGRNRIIQFVTFAALVGGGLLLDLFKTSPHNPFRGFVLLFLLAMAGRSLSFLFLSKQSDYPHAEGDGSGFTFASFLKGMHRNNYGLFVLYATLFSIAINISAPYFIPFMLNRLGFSYFQFTVILGAMIGFKFLTLPVWGRLSDRYGTRKLLVLSCWLLCLPPLLWMVSKNFYYLIAIQAVAGTAIGGFELCSFNFLLDATTPSQRTRSAAYFEICTGAGVVAGSILGGLLLRYAPLASAPYLLIFLVSGILRLLASSVFLGRIREIRTVEQISYRELLSQFFQF